MKVFHELAFEGVVAQGAGFQFSYPTSDPRLHELMGAVDMLHVSGYAAQASGTSPALTISLQFSNDRTNWYDASFTPIVNGLSLSSSQETLFQGSAPDPGANFKFAYARLAFTLGGTTAQTFLRVWVTGRDCSRRSAGGAATAARASGRSQAPARASGLSRA